MSVTPSNTPIAIPNALQSRVEQLREILQAAPESGVSVPQLVKQLQTDRATVYRYIKLYGGQLGIMRVSRGRYRIDRRVEEINLQLSADESLALFLSTRLLARMTDRRYPAAASAVAKLSGALHQHSPQLAAQMRQSAAKFAKNKRPESHEWRMLHLVIDAFAAAYYVELDYLNRFDERRSLTFAPYFFEPYPERRTVHIIGQAVGYDHLITVRTDRIRRATLTTTPYTIPDDIDFTERFHDAWGIWVGDEQTTVRLRFDAELRTLANGTIWHHSQSAPVTNPDGTLELEFKVSTWREMVKWVLSFGNRVTVLAPLEFRNAIQAQLHDALAHYRDTEHPT